MKRDKKALVVVCLILGVAGICGAAWFAARSNSAVLGPGWIVRSPNSNGRDPPKLGSYKIRFDDDGKVQYDRNGEVATGSFSTGIGGSLKIDFPGGFLSPLPGRTGDPDMAFRDIEETASYHISPSGELVLMTSLDKKILFVPLSGPGPVMSTAQRDRIIQLSTDKLVPPPVSDGKISYVQFQEPQSQGGIQSRSFDSRGFRVRRDLTSKKHNLVLEVLTWQTLYSLGFATENETRFEVGKPYVSAESKASMNLKGINYRGTFGGKFVVWEVEYDAAGQITALALDFIQGANASTRVVGALRFNSKYD